VLVVLCENLLEICLSYVLGGSKLKNFVRQILNYRIAFILRRREYVCMGSQVHWFTFREKKLHQHTNTSLVISYNSSTWLSLMTWSERRRCTQSYETTSPYYALCIIFSFIWTNHHIIELTWDNLKTKNQPKLSINACDCQLPLHPFLWPCRYM